MQVHRSNYRITGFTEQVAIPELVGLDVPVVVDLGSGLLDAACPWLAGGPPDWLGDEPAARQTLDAGADLVVFSGDKLLGGPQAGLIAGPVATWWRPAVVIRWPGRCAPAAWCWARCRTRR